MNDTLEIREARADEIALVQELIREMAKYEKRPEDMTGTQESLSYWLFERKIATILLLEYEKKVIGYAIYYPVFGSFAACGGIHLEDLYIKAEYRKHGFGRYFFDAVAKRAKAEAIAGWSGPVWIGIRHRSLFMRNWGQPMIAEESI
ncbi:GNAT family N-acetyltransferase [Roseburia sp. AM51-8]|uniref:GNAT family N-acetyltransferase n=1 Tax=Roseburia sp. AM51-8 TaxID=2292366 RepID=UPI001FAAA01C|nr:GNAT family N-acetyltransferase [Roseburia sp. AM51-8]